VQKNFASLAAANVALARIQNGEDYRQVLE
jgi:hypothetical protein